MTANVGTYDNILPAGITTLTVQGITGKPTGYNVYYGGAMVTSGSWPAPVAPSFTGGSDNSVTATGTGSLTLTPTTTGGATPQTTSTLVVTVGPDSPGQPNLLTISGGNATWSDPLPTSGQNKPAIFVGAVTTAGAAPITITANTGQQITGTVTSWQNVTQYGPVDQGGTKYSAPGSTTATGLTIAPTVSDELLIGVVSGSATVGSTFGTPLFTEFTSDNPYKTGNGTCNYSAGYYVPATPITLGTWGWNVSGGSAGTTVGVVSLSPAVGGTTINIALPSGWSSWKPGHYFIDFVVSTSGINGFSVDSVQVNLFRDLGHLPSPTSLPPVGSNPLITTFPDGQSDDLVMHAMLGHGGIRYSISTVATPTAQGLGNFSNGSGETIAGIQTAIANETGPGMWFSTGQIDPARPRPRFINFPNDIPMRYDTITDMSSGATDFFYWDCTTDTWDNPLDTWDSA